MNFGQNKLIAIKLDYRIVLVINGDKIHKSNEIIIEMFECDIFLEFVIKSILLIEDPGKNILPNLALLIK